MTTKAKMIHLWQTSDGRKHNDEEFANRHERFLEVVKATPKLKANTYENIMALLERYDFVEKKTVVEPNITGHTKVGTCSVCLLPQYDSPGGAVCAKGHGGAPSL